MLGEYEVNRVYAGDCLNLSRRLPSDCIDVIVTSPPYWGQRESAGIGTEEDPRGYLDALLARFQEFKRILKPQGIVWVNLGDSYNTPVNWKKGDHRWSSLGPDRKGFSPDNVAYIKPRFRRRAYVQREVPWLQYGNLLALPYRLVVGLCDGGYLFRGEVIWRKRNPMPEGKCRRPHRGHEAIYLLAKDERHGFRVAPPVRSVWEFGNEVLGEVRHFSRFPVHLPRKCIEAYGKTGPGVVVLDPFSGSGTTGRAAIYLGCAYLGFEVDPSLAAQSDAAIQACSKGTLSQGRHPTPSAELVESGAPLFGA